MLYRMGAALALLLLAAPPAEAQAISSQKFREFVAGLPTAVTPGASDRVPILQNGALRALLGNGIGSGTPPPECPDTGGQHLNYASGAWVCGTTGGSGGSGSGTGAITWDDGTALLWDDGTAIAGL